MGMRKDVFLSIGGYDEEFKGYAVDDVELIQRLRMNGCTYYQTQTHIVHIYHSKYMDVRAGFKDIKEQEKQHQFNKDLYETKKDIIIRNRKNSWGELI
jgi:GT2 family glycosyltransferase